MGYKEEAFSGCASESLLETEDDDILARIVAQKLSDWWGQQVVVENRPGASATIASGVVAHAAPDGYTLSMGQLTPNAIAPALYATLPYDARKDLVPIVLASG